VGVRGLWYFLSQGIAKDARLSSITKVKQSQKLTKKVLKIKTMQNTTNNAYKYVIYCRKSSESEDKQVQSIETQMRELADFAKRNDLAIVETIQESKSAFKAGRPEFARMISLIRTGKANAILVVRANRISRNAIDGAQIITLMDEKKLKFIRTPAAACFTGSSSDKFMLGLELIVSKKDSDDKGDAVKEGQRTKALKGFPHGLAAIGFLNDKTEERGNRKWLVDKDRFPVIQKIFEMYLTGTWSVNKLARYTREELKLTTPSHKRTGGALVALSRVHTILRDPIYAGFFFYNGVRYELEKSLPRVITEEQHEKVKRIMTGKNIPKAQNHVSVFTGHIWSPQNEFIGQDVKFQLICDCKYKFCYLNKVACPKCNTELTALSKPKYLEYTYYYNVTRRKRHLPTKYLKEPVLLNQIITHLSDNLELSSEFINWCKNHINQMKDTEIQNSIQIEKSNQDKIEEVQNKKSRLRSLLADEIISHDEYKKDIAKLDSLLPKIKQVTDTDWREKANSIIDLTQEAIKILQSASKDEKRMILKKLGSHLV
jgi:DNA invertase Pin-like site-specific DNA recombinase